MLTTVWYVDLLKCRMALHGKVDSQVKVTHIVLDCHKPDQHTGDVHWTAVTTVYEIATCCSATASCAAICCDLLLYRSGLANWLASHALHA